MHSVKQTTYFRSTNDWRGTNHLEGGFRINILREMPLQIFLVFFDVLAIVLLISNLSTA